MKNAVVLPQLADVTDPAEIDTDIGAAVHDDVHVEQLTLLPRHEVPNRFRLPDDTRRRGLRHVAEIRQMLAERDAVTAPHNVHRLPPRTRRAA